MADVLLGRVLVVGGDHQNTLGVIEALGQKGVGSYVVIYPSVHESFVLASKYVKEGWICTTEEDVINTILHEMPRQSERMVSIACSDDTAIILDSHYNELNNALVIPTIKDAGRLIDWTDKDTMIKAAKELGINTPESWLINGTSIPVNIIYPCLIKPITSVRHGKKGFAKCSNEIELQTYLDTKEEGESVQIQQFVEKDFEFQFIGCSLKFGEKVIIPGRTHIEKTTDFNNLVFLRYDRCDASFNKIVEQSKKFVKKTGYSGLFSIEFMRGKDGKDYFLEMNYRNDGNAISVTSSGTNLPYIWYLYASGGDYQAELANSDVKTTYMMPEISFLMSVLSGEISFREWRADCKKTTCYLTRFDDDMAPYKSLMKRFRKGIIQGWFLFILRKVHLYNMIRTTKRGIKGLFNRA